MNIKHSSETNEHFTPPEYVEAARQVLGHIDLDPASSALANETVKAERYFTVESNGYLEPWAGRVFLNPPGGWCDVEGRPVIKRSGKRPPCTETGACGLPAPHRHEQVDSALKRWWFKLAEEYRAGRVTSAIFVGFNMEFLQTTQQVDGAPLPLQFPFCVPRERMRFSSLARGELSTGNSPTHANVIVFLPPRRADLRRFVDEFSAFGRVALLHAPARSRAG